MLKAGALYYAIMIWFIVALLSGFLMLSIWFNHYFSMRLFQSQRLERNVNSALILAKDAPEMTRINQSFTVDLYE